MKVNIRLKQSHEIVIQFSLKKWINLGSIGTIKIRLNEVFNVLDFTTVLWF